MNDLIRFLPEPVLHGLILFELIMFLVLDPTQQNHMIKTDPSTTIFHNYTFFQSIYSIITLLKLPSQRSKIQPVSPLKASL